MKPIAALLDEAQDQLLGAGIKDRISRVEITKNAVMQLEVDSAHGLSWYELANGKLAKLEIVDDRKVPLAARLRDPDYAANTRPLSYRPGKRLTLLDQSSHKPKILKGFRRGRLDRMVRNYEMAHAAFAARGVQTPEIIEYDTEFQALVMLFKGGERLRLSADNTELFYLVGQYLQEFQDHHDGTDDSPFEAQDELGVLDQRRARLVAAGAEMPEAWTGLRERLGEMGQNLPPPAHGLAHRDLHDKQFIQQADHLVILDFDLVCRADVTLDPANFLAHLVLRNLQEAAGATQRSIDDCGRQFLQGLARNEEPGFWERLRFYQATTFCRLALVYAVRPAWAHLFTDLVTMGHRCLDDLRRIRGN